MKTIRIIGAGIGGLALANLLAQDGHEVHVHEKNEQLGGRAGQFTKDGFTFDTGPSWYLMSEVFDHYFKLLGTSAKAQLKLKKLSPAYKVFTGDENLIITGDLEKDSRTFEAIEPGSGEALRRYIEKSRTTYRLALKYFLYTNFKNPRELVTKETLRHIHEVAALAFMPMHQYVKKYFTSTRLQQVLEYPTVFLGSSPYSAPALYSLMSALDFDEGVYYPKGTMYAVPEALVSIGKKLGVQYHTGNAVKHIAVDKGSASGITLEDGSHCEADIIISNADLHHTETSLLEPQYQSYPKKYWQTKEPSPSALLMYLGVKGSIPEFEHHTLLFVDDWKTNFNAIFKTKSLPTPASLYISKTSASDTTAPKGHENIFVLVPLPAGISLSKDELETVADGYLTQIKQTTGVDLAARTVSRTLFGPNDFASKYNSWQSSMLGPSHLLKQSAFFRTGNKSKKVKNLYYVGAGTRPGIGVPMCLISAQLVHEHIQKESR